MNDKKPHALVQETIDLINNRSVKTTLDDIYKATDVPVAWISLLANGKIKEPSANRVLALYEHMTGKNIQESLSKN